MQTNLSSTNCVVSAVNFIVKLNRENLFPNSKFQIYKFKPLLELIRKSRFTQR